MKKKKFYTVLRGLKPGIYETWRECEAQVKGFNGARFASFDSREEAEEALNSDPNTFRKSKVQKDTNKKRKLLSTGFTGNSIAVDAACSGNPGVMEYRGVYTETGTEIFHAGPFPQGTNNIGEFLAIVHALAWMKKSRLELPVYSDSTIAILWVKKKKVNTKMVPTKKNQKLFEILERALIWLSSNEYNNPVLKWETQDWGEVPADFGRKGT